MDGQRNVIFENVNTNWSEVYWCSIQVFQILVWNFESIQFHHFQNLHLKKCTSLVNQPSLHRQGVTTSVWSFLAEPRPWFWKMHEKNTSFFFFSFLWTCATLLYFSNQLQKALTLVIFTDHVICSLMKWWEHVLINPTCFFTTSKFVSYVDIYQDMHIQCVCSIVQSLSDDIRIIVLDAVAPERLILYKQLVSVADYFHLEIHCQNYQWKMFLHGLITVDCDEATFSNANWC